MSDREKTMKRLEECLSASCRGFRTCPYNDTEWDAVRAAYELLKGQDESYAYDKGYTNGYVKGYHDAWIKIADEEGW